MTSPWLSLAEPPASFSSHLSSSIRPGQQGDLPHQPSLAYKSPSSMPCVTWHHRAGVQPLLSRSIVCSFKIVRGKNQEKITQKNQLTTQRQHYLVIVRKFWPSERPLMVYFLGWILWSLRDPECFIKQIFWPPSDEYYYCLFKYQFWSLQTYSYRLDHLLHWSLSQGPPSLSAMRPLLHKSVPGMWASYVVFMYK